MKSLIACWRFASAFAIALSIFSSFAEYEQLVGGVDTLFKTANKTVMAYAENAYKTAGMSANEYMNTITSFSASLIQSLGGDTEKAAEVGNMAITDMSDNANKMGTSMEMIQNAYNGFAKQNYTMLDNLKLGYGGTAGEMARLINDSGVLGDTVKVTASTVNSVSFDKMIEAIHVVQERLGITGTSAEEASKTVQGSVNSMKSAWSDLVTGMANENADIEALIGNFISSAGTALENLMPVVVNALSNIANVVKGIIPVMIKSFVDIFNSLAKELPGIVKELLPALLQGLRELFNGLYQVLPEFVQMIVDSMPMIMDAIVQLLSQLVEAIPTIIPQLIEALTNLVTTIAIQLTRPDFLQLLLQGALTLFTSLIRAIPQILTSLIQALPQIITNIIQFLTDPANIMMIIQAAVELFFGLVQAVPQILGALLGAFGELVGNLWEGIKNMFGEFAANFGNFIGNIFKNAINGVLQFIENIINGPIDLINGFIGAINDAFGFIGVNLGKLDRISLPRLAQGGIATAATPAIIGEAGKEAVLPLENNTDNWAGLLAETLAVEMQEQDYDGKTINVYMTNEINNELDAQEIGRVMMQSIRRAA